MTRSALFDLIKAHRKAAALHEIMTDSQQYLEQQMNGCVNNTSLNGIFLTEILVNTKIEQ